MDRQLTTAEHDLTQTVRELLFAWGVSADDLFIEPAIINRRVNFSQHLGLFEVRMFHSGFDIDRFWVFLVHHGKPIQIAARAIINIQTCRVIPQVDYPSLMPPMWEHGG